MLPSPLTLLLLLLLWPLIFGVVVVAVPFQMSWWMLLWRLSLLGAPSGFPVGFVTLVFAGLLVFPFGTPPWPLTM